MKKYEIILLLDPTIGDSEIDAAFESVLELLRGQAVEIIQSETLDWGKRKLAYPVRKKETAYYRIFRFNAKTQVIGEIERRLRIDERVMRSMIVLYDPDTEKPIKPAEAKED